MIPPKGTASNSTAITQKNANFIQRVIVFATSTFKQTNNAQRNNNTSKGLAFQMVNNSTFQLMIDGTASIQI